MGLSVMSLATRKDISYNITADISKSFLPTLMKVREEFVVQSHKMEDRGV